MSSKIIQIVTVGRTMIGEKDLYLTPAGKGQMNNILNSGLLFPNPVKVIAGTEEYFTEAAKWLGKKIDKHTEICEIDEPYSVPFALLKDAKNTEFCGVVKELYDMIINDLPDKSLLVVDCATVSFSHYPQVKRDFFPGTLIEIKISKDEGHSEDGFTILFPQTEAAKAVA